MGNILARCVLAICTVPSCPCLYVYIFYINYKYTCVCVCVNILALCVLAVVLYLLARPFGVGVEVEIATRRNSQELRPYILYYKKKILQKKNRHAPQLPGAQTLYITYI
jgi:hypothetical protein